MGRRHDSLPVNELTRATNPIKLYEYFSAGLPVVSTRLPEVELYRDLTYLADSPTEFSRLSALAVAEQDESLREKRMQIAGLHTWRARAEALLDRIRMLGAI